MHADRFRVAVGNLERVWRNFQVQQVFRADTASMLRSGLHWLLAMMSGGWLLPPPKSLFDNSPLRELLRAAVRLRGHPPLDRRRAISMRWRCRRRATSSARSVSFYEAQPGCEPWSRMRRARRAGARCRSIT